MKKSILVFAMCMVMITSCNKSKMDYGRESNGEKVKLSFSVAEPSSAVGSLDSDKKTSLGKLINQLTFVVYFAQTHVEAMRMTQFSTDPNFGQVALELEKDRFYIVAIGSKTEFGINQFYKRDEVPVILPFSEAHMEYWQRGDVMGLKEVRTDDTFFAKTEIDVTEAAQIKLELQRIVGKLDVIVDDVEDYTVNIRNEATGYMFQSETSFGKVEDEFYYLDSKKGPISVYVLRTNVPLNIVVSYGTALSQQRSLMVPIQKNKRTVVRGKMRNPVANSFSVTINDKWLPETDIIEL